ncbi:MAG TPA: ribose-phosphate pyrophosphokinase, partial [Saprospiraceae bacterium]|nr:ribose-phosphate pyrophosphokinase [Saprospiraceae bacterium]
LCKAADALIEKGAKSVKAMLTHAVLSGNAYENINNSLITEVIVTDSIPLRGKSDKIVVLSCAKLFARAIRNTHEYKSIAALFVDKNI